MSEDLDESHLGKIIEAVVGGVAPRRACHSKLTHSSCEGKGREPSTNNNQPTNEATTSESVERAAQN